MSGKVTQGAFGARTGSELINTIEFGSSTGTELRSSCPELEWTGAQASTVDVVCGQIAREAVVDEAQFDRCFRLLSEGYGGHDGAADEVIADPIAQTFQEAIEQAEGVHRKLRISGFLAKYPQFMQSLLESDHAVSEVLGEHDIADLCDIMNEVNDTRRLDRLSEWYSGRSAMVPTTIEIPAGAGTEDKPSDLGGPDPPTFLSDDAADGMVQVILEAKDMGQLAERLALQDPEAVASMLNKLIQGDFHLTLEEGPETSEDKLRSRVVQRAFDLKRRLAGGSSAIQHAEEAGSDSGAAWDELHEMNREALEQLLLSPVSPNTLAETYYPPAFCSHVMGLLVPE